MSVLIISAGIGGLTLALRLRQAGIDCAVYEQSSTVRELGVGITLQPNTVGHLAELGLLDELRETGVCPRRLLYAHRLGPQILLRPCGRDAGFAMPHITIHRGRLQGLLYRAVLRRLGTGAVRTGHRLTGFSAEDDGVRASFAAPDGSALGPVRGDLLVAADGIHSTVRSALFPEEGPPRWGGITLWRGCADWPAFDDGELTLIAGGNTAKTVVYPIGPGRSPGTRLTNWAVCIKTGRDGDPPPHEQDWSRLARAADVAVHLKRFRSPHVDIEGLVRTTGECFEFPMCDRDPLPWWGRGRVTLLGDAAHPMYPMGSNGAGQAIMDSGCLARCLASGASPCPEESLRRYERERLPVTGDVVLRNRAGGPESVIDEVERRAPGGFSRLEDVIDPSELEAIVSGYARASGQAASGR